MLEELFKSSTSVLLLGVIIGLLIIQILLSSFSSKERREPPGPRPFLLLGNLLQVDPKRLDKSLFDVRNFKKKKNLDNTILSLLFRIMNLTYVHMISVQLSKTYGPVFTVYFGLKKVIVIAGYRAVKEALVNHAEEFGNREVTPVFYDFNKGHGKKILFELVTLFIFSFSSC